MVPSDNATDPPPYADLARVVAGVAAVEHVGLADEGGGEGGGPPRRGRGLGLEAVLDREGC